MCPSMLPVGNEKRHAAHKAKRIYGWERGRRRLFMPGALTGESLFDAAPQVCSFRLIDLFMT